MTSEKYILYSTKRWTSLLKKLREEKKINEEFEIVLHSLSLEDLIAIKLELSTKTLNSPLYGFPILKSMRQIAEEAALKFAFSTTRTAVEAAKVLGISKNEMLRFAKKYKIYDFFGFTRRKKRLEAEKSTPP